MKKATAKIKKEKLSPEDERVLRMLERTNGGLIENFNHTLKGIKEGNEAIQEKLERIEKTLDSHTTMLNEHTNILHSHTRVLDSHTKKLDSHTERIGSLMMDMTEVKSNTKDLAFIMKSLSNGKLDKKYFVDLDQRVRVLETA